MMLLINFKLNHPDARLPSQADGDVGFDLYSCEDSTIPAGRVIKVKTGLHIAGYDPCFNVDEPTRGRHMLTVYPKIEGRSSLGSRGIFPVGGIIDPVYRGELVVTLANMSGDDCYILKSDKIAQLVFYTCMASPELQFKVIDEIVPTLRGDKGFGSTGR